MFGRTRLRPVESIDMLRSKGLRKYTEVRTSDGERLGVALRYFHRPIEDVNDDLKLYRSYLVVQSIPLGGPAYIPTGFIRDFDPGEGVVTLAVDLNTVLEEVWNREPDFIARGLGVPEELPV